MVTSKGGRSALVSSVTGCTCNIIRKVVVRQISDDLSNEQVERKDTEWFRQVRTDCLAELGTLTEAEKREVRSAVAWQKSRLGL